ncbi:hypothetical protein DNTS_007566 [Danionella cerebrum]|uniref:Amine oxidase domain-containing protein n=1 Tax=Danionella cerebrum TaxID=2873325 RepID=A0A553N592_9TELE|nr:hypothetical protein DNTS_007566 [Danionella translucida]
MWLLLWMVSFMVWVGGTIWFFWKKPSPYSVASVRPAEPLVLDQKIRDKVLKQGFTKDKVPENLDAIIIGSGIGGMTVAATLAKAGKKVLVLEQHDVAGGCCHTFTEKGFEFDVGLHYFGQLHENGLFRVAFDQITEGQLQFAELPQHFDSVVIDEGEKPRVYPILSGRVEMEKNLKKLFPDEHKAVEEFFKDMKLMPQWLALFLLKSGIADLISPVFRLSTSSSTEMNYKLTSNKDLHLVFSYYFYGTAPKESSYLINALLLHHFKRGAYYPKGGASEIPFHITRVIQKYGGRVLVRAPVSRILVDQSGAAYGVTVKKGEDHVEIRAPVIISNCGIFNTFQKLLPPEIQSKPGIQSRVDMMRPGKASFLLFSGFDATQEELGIPRNSVYVFKSNDMDGMMDEYFSMSKDEAPENVPMLLLTFPSAKDPGSQIKHPGKSCMTILTMVNYEWFEEWKDTRVRKRGDDYFDYKMRFTNYIFDWACKLFPKIRDRLVYQEAATPLTNMHYLGSHLGAIYATDQNIERFYAEAVARNRCDTPVKNLYLSGQDIFSCGIAGALHGGLLCASTVLNYPVYIDLLFIKKKLKWMKAREMEKQVKQKQQMWLLLVSLFVGGMIWLLWKKPSPYSVASVRPVEPLVLDQKIRDKVLKQGFTKDKVPENLDAIIIGSGIGGMTVAATLAKAGKKVLVLEQHDVAGGCCHTFTEKGFEFDVGVHYFGQLHENGLFKVAFDQITEGQLEFVELPQYFDSVVIDDGEKLIDYPVLSGKVEMMKNLKKLFPDDHKAIDEFFKVMKLAARRVSFLGALKLMPQWLALFLLKSGIGDLISPVFRLSGASATEMNHTLTSNKDLHLLFSYYFYGTAPKESSYLINALMLQHFKRGAYYPRGGASEIPFHITRVIQKYGGRVLVRAPVSRILVDQSGAAYEIQSRVDMMRPGKASFLLFSGFDATQEELGITPTSYWMFKSNDMDGIEKPQMDEYFSMSKEEAPENVPMVLLTFPSAKDPTSQMRHPGKSCMTILTMVNYEWFEEWKDTRVRKRGDDYFDYKMRFANCMFDWACKLFPKIRDRLVYQEAATPLSNMHYLSSNLGAIYSTDHNLERFYAESMARNRCDTPVKNLYLSGQDIFSCGVAGALHGGLLCASTVLNYPVYIDLMYIKKKLKWMKAREMEKQVKQKQQ